MKILLLIRISLEVQITVELLRDHTKKICRQIRLYAFTKILVNTMKMKMISYVRALFQSKKKEIHMTI